MMGYVDQGYFARCDNCDEDDAAPIGCRRKWKVERDIRRAGWIIFRNTILFCSEKCRDEWREKNGLPQGEDNSGTNET